MRFYPLGVAENWKCTQCLECDSKLEYYGKSYGGGWVSYYKCHNCNIFYEHMQKISVDSCFSLKSFSPQEKPLTRYIGKHDEIEVYEPLRKETELEKAVKIFLLNNWRNSGYLKDVEYVKGKGFKIDFHRRYDGIDEEIKTLLKKFQKQYYER